MTEEWMSIDEAAAYLNVGRRAIHKYIQQGKLPAFKTLVGRRTLLRREEVKALLVPRPLQIPSRLPRPQ